MGLNKVGLVNDIKAINAEMANEPGITADQWAQKMADAIDAYVKSGEVTITAGQSMMVTTPPVQSNTTLANGGGPVLGTIATPNTGFEWKGTIG